VGRYLGWAALGLLLGILAGAAGGLLRRRPVPETITYVPPRPADGPTATGPHREVRRA